MAATTTVRTAARRILVVASETVDTQMLADVLRFRTRTQRDVDLLVIAPALHLTRSLDQLREAGFDAEGLVADADPIRAIDDALTVFPADEIVLANDARGHSNQLARDLVHRARLRYAQPILHVVVASAPP